MNVSGSEHMQQVRVQLDVCFNSHISF